MPCCSAVGCSNRTEGGVKLYRFPSNRERLQIWKKKVGRLGWEPTSSSYLCQEHFEQDQIENRRADGKKKLRWNAVPTIFPHQSTPNHKPPPIMRSLPETRNKNADSPHHTRYKHQQTDNVPSAFDMGKDGDKVPCDIKEEDIEIKEEPIEEKQEVPQDEDSGSTAQWTQKRVLFPDAHLPQAKKHHLEMEQVWIKEEPALAVGHILEMEKKLSSTSYSSKREQQLLFELFEAKRHILMDKKTEFSMKGKQKKAEAWQSIAKQYNLAALGPHKSIPQLKRMWQHIKVRAKQEYIQEKKKVMRTRGLPKPGEGAATATTIQSLSTNTKELESGGNDSDVLPSSSKCGIDLKHQADETAIIVECGSGQRVVPPTTTPPSTTQPAHPAPSASTPYTRQTKHALTPQEASIEEFCAYRHKEHEMNMKIKAIELKIKEADLMLKHKDARLKDADLQIKELELRIKEKEYLIKEKDLENLSI